MNKKLRNTLIKVAHKNPELKPKVLSLLASAKGRKSKFLDAMEGKKFKHPETGKDVKYHSLPMEDRIRIQKEWHESNKKKPETKSKKKVEDDLEKESSTQLRDSLIRIAHKNPELRIELLSLITKNSD